MTHDRNQLDPVEEALLELQDMDRARLFRRTQVDEARLVAGRVTAQSSGSRRVTMRLVPVAAALVMAIGVWSWMFSAELAETRRAQDASPVLVADATAPDPGSFHRCFAGPTAGTSSSCQELDYDSDGDVDLADFGAYQLAYADTAR
jgi:hypothetical protein